MSSGNIRELDASFSVPLMDHHDDHFEYYAATSLQHRLAAEVRVPTLILHAEDDPVCVARGIPLSAPFLNDKVLVVRTREGGHISWREGCCPWGRGWGERTAVEFAAAAMEGAIEGWDGWAEPSTGEAEDDDASSGKRSETPDSMPGSTAAEDARTEREERIAGMQKAQNCLVRRESQQE